MKRTTMAFSVALTTLLGVCAANAADEASASEADEGFLSDYTKLQPVKGDEYEKSWSVADAETRAVKYKSIMIDQPEIFISPESKYKGAKPDDLKILADELRNTFRKEIEMSGKYAVVEAPGPDVLYMRVAISDLMMQKKKRPVRAYIPVGAVLYGAKKLTQEMTEKMDLTNAKLESEVLDSVTNEPLGAYVVTRRSDSELSWDELTAAFSGAGKRMACRLENARVPAEQRKNCAAIPITATKPAD